MNDQPPADTFVILDHRTEFRAIVFRVARKRRLAMEQALAAATSDHERLHALAEYAGAIHALLGVLSEMEGGGADG